MTLSKEESESLYAARKRPAFTSIHWDPPASRHTSHTIRFPVFAESDDTELLVVGWWAREEGLFGFSLQFRGQPVRTWDDHGRRQRRKAGGVPGSHKHPYDPEDPTGGGVPYPAPDITEKDPTRAMIQFLRECNVDTSKIAFQDTLPTEP